MAKQTLREIFSRDLLSLIVGEEPIKECRTLAVCAANSRVGEITSALGVPILPLLLLGFLHLEERTSFWRSGSPNMIDLPLPVGDDAMTSWPFRSKGMAWA